MIVKDIINWKAFNYLLDKLTGYEDNGNFVVLRITIEVKNYYHCIYRYSTIGGKNSDRLNEELSSELEMS